MSFYSCTLKEFIYAAAGFAAAVSLTASAAKVFDGRYFKFLSYGEYAEMQRDARDAQRQIETLTRERDAFRAKTGPEFIAASVCDAQIRSATQECKIGKPLTPQAPPPQDPTTSRADRESAPVPRAPSGSPASPVLDIKVVSATLENDGSSPNYFQAHVTVEVVNMGRDDLRIAFSAQPITLAIERGPRAGATGQWQCAPNDRDCAIHEKSRFRDLGPGARTSYALWFRGKTGNPDDITKAVKARLEAELVAANTEGRELKRIGAAGDTFPLENIYRR